MPSNWRHDLYNRDECMTIIASTLKPILVTVAACSIGRPYLYGLAVGGEAGVTKAIEILEAETRRAMLLAGFESTQSLRSASPVRPVGLVNHLPVK